MSRWPDRLERTSRKLGARLGMSVWLGLLAGCATRPMLPGAAQLDAIRARAEARFARAFYLKPAVDDAVPERARQLAPLLILEAPTTNPPADWPNADAPGKIFFQAGVVRLNGRRHEQMTYAWSYPRGDHRRGSSLTQAVRLTLNDAGLPAIWEVLADTSGARVIFVSQNLEAQAARAFGLSVAGRSFAVERPTAETPNVVVARVIEDGPVAMGPIVYLRAGTRDVSTVICRCMDSQARELAGQGEYQLQPGPAGDRLWPSGLGVDQALRLPADF